MDIIVLTFVACGFIPAMMTISLGIGMIIGVVATK